LGGLHLRGDGGAVSANAREGFLTAKTKWSGKFRHPTFSFSKWPLADSDGFGPDVCMECAGIPPTLRQAFAYVRKGDIVVLNGEQGPLEEAAQAYTAMAQGKSGKVLLTYS
jgi:NADPH:quinone reductase-like Zn-dependent oxidoreductase